MQGPSGFETEFETKMREKGYVIREGTTSVGYDSEVVKELSELNEDNPVGVNEKELQDFKLPPDPVPFRDYDPDEVSLRYIGSKTDMASRLVHKILYIWVFWAQLRTNPAIEELLSTKCDQESDEYKAKATIVEIIDRMAKILSDTDTKEEMRYLYSLSDNLQEKFSSP